VVLDCCSEAVPVPRAPLPVHSGSTPISDIVSAVQCLGPEKIQKIGGRSFQRILHPLVNASASVGVPLPSDICVAGPLQ
jgi:hypothetical protein